MANKIIFSVTGFVSFLSLFLLLTSCSCSSGGDGTDITDDPAPNMPSRVVYVADTRNTTVDITNVNSNNATLSISAGFFLQGNYITASKQYSLDLSPVPRLDMTPTSILDFELPIHDEDGGLSFLIDQSLTWTAGRHLSSGEFWIISGNSIRVTVNNDIDGAGTPGVDIALVEFGVTSASSSLSWPDFEAALNNSAADPYQREASLAYLTFKYLYRPLYRVMENFDTLRTQENAFEAGGPGTTLAIPLCSEFNGMTGTFNLTWIDNTGEIAGGLGSGDSFTIAVNNCWLDDPASNDDLLYASGQMQLNSYGESSSPFYLGFDEVVFDNLQVNQTAQDGTVIVDDTYYHSASDITTGRNGFYFELTPDVSSILNLTNLEQVASATAISMTMPSELGNFAVNMLSAVIADNKISGTLLCSVSGSFDYSLNNLPFDSTASMTVDFDNGDNCIQGTAGDQIAVHGGYVLAATAFTSIDDLAFDLAFTSISTQDAVGTRNFNGQIHFMRSVSGATSNEVSSSISGQSLNTSENGITASLSSFSFTGSRTASGVTLGAPNETFALQLSSLTDSLSGIITTTLSGPEMTALQAGSFRMTASDTSNFLLTITNDSGDVSLALDSDGDGSADDTVNTSWDDLY